MKTFGELNRLDWPLKSAINLLSNIIFEINPFQIALLFLDVIDELANFVKLMSIRKGIKSNDVELDFDQLFSLLLVTIFASVIKELPLIMEYTSYYREICPIDDAHIQYAMGHLDGITAFLNQMDLIKLKKKSEKLILDYLDNIDDPLK